MIFGDIPTVIPSISMVASETSTTDFVISLPLLTLMLLSLLIGGPGLAWRRVSPRSSDHHPSFSSLPTDSLPLHSLGLDAPGQAHYGSSTQVVSPRLGYHSVRAPRHRDSSERPLHSSSHSAGPSRKRCRSPADSVPSSTLVKGSLAPTHSDLLPPRKRELDIVDRDDVRDHIEVDPRDDREEFEASAGDTVVLGIDPRSVPMVDEEIIEPVGGDSSRSSGTRDGTVRLVEDIPVDLDGAIRGFYHHMSKVRVDRIVEIETTQRQLEGDQMIASGERELIRDDRDDLRRKLRRLESFAKRRLGLRP
uniref:Uncharacterized protein n=1 Tax=Tanacetum cinerariifolium TaxID=118510 RepID=A0A6L2LU01_TANCI|nr:hypothetical protein [Tanacetum cinerariifolium]